MAARPIPDRSRSARSAARLLAGIAILLLAALLIWRPWAATPTIAPARLTKAEAAGLADDALVGRLALDLQFILVAPYEDPVAWKKLPEAARHLFILTYADEQLRRERLLDLCVRIRTLRNEIPLSLLADAYAAVGMEAPAEVIRRAVAIEEAQEPAIQASIERRIRNGGVDPAIAEDPFAKIQGDVRAALGKGRLGKPGAAYIRAHADEILAP